MSKYYIQSDWEGPCDNLPSCVFNPCVGCGDRKCVSCGHNPFVARKRITEKYGAKYAKFVSIIKDE